LKVRFEEGVVVARGEMREMFVVVVVGVVVV